MKKRKLLPLIALCMLLMFKHHAMAQTAIERLKAEYPAVMEQYGKKLQALHTHYIFVIDVSGTMDQYKDDVVVPGISNFLNTLPEGNYASIVAFGGKAAEMCTPLKINKENRKILIDNLNKSYREAGRLQSNATLLNIASAKVLDVVKKDTVSDVCFAVFFSDLCDEASDWNYRDRVLELKGRAFGVIATALFANNDAQQQKGIKRMENTFPGFSYSSNVKDVFGEKLENFKFNIYIPELKKIIQKELKQTIEGFQLSSTLSIDKSVKLSAEYDQRTPAFVKGICVDTVSILDQSPIISKVNVLSGVKLPRHRSSSTLGNLDFLPEGKLFHYNPYLSFALRYHLSTPEPETDKDPNFIQDLEKLELADALYSEAELEAKAPFVIGWNFWLFCIITLAVLLYLLLFIWNTLIPHRIKGKKLAVKNPVTENIQFYPIPNMHSFTVGKQGCNCVIPGAQFVLKATCRNGSPLNLLWKRRLSLRLDPKSGTGVDLSQGSRNNLKTVSIRKGKDALITHNINTRFIITLAKN
ncbi:MAG: VWA domain-containing protein [Paludibacteraceae bacterium]|nr:VWA domain-containing protein [Paludibacteraceae bacterium]